MSFRTLLPALSLPALFLLALGEGRSELLAQTGPVKTPAQKPQGRSASIGDPVGQASRAKRPQPPRNQLVSYPFTKPFAFFKPVVTEEPAEHVVEVLRLLDGARARYLRAKERGQDAFGRPYIEDIGFKDGMGALLPKIRELSGYYPWLVAEHANRSHRRAAYFGGLYLEEPREVFALLALAPMEPDATVRARAIRMGLPILRSYLPLRGKAEKPEVFDPRKKGPKPPFTYDFDPTGYANLLRSASVEDRMYGLAMLRILTRTRPEVAAEWSRRMERWIIENLNNKHEVLAESTRDFVTDLGSHRPGAPAKGMPCPEEAEASVAHYRKLLRLLFPDIRLEGGVLELYEGPDLAKAVEDLEALAKSGDLGFQDSQELRSEAGSQHRYGLRLRERKALEPFGLPGGILVLTLDGQSMRKPDQALAHFKRGLGQGQRRFVLTYLDAKGRERVLQIRYEPKV